MISLESNLRLAVSAEFVRPGRVGGTEQALHYVMDGLRASLAEDDKLVIVASPDALPTEYGDHLSVPPHPHSVRFVQETRTLASFRGEVDAVYYPNYFTPPVRRAPRIVTTIPDLQYLHFADNFSKQKRAWLAVAHRATLRRADVVTAYSAAVRDDLLERYGTQHGGKVVVMPIPVNWDRFGRRASSPPARPYVLAVASHYSHKNLSTLVRSFDIVRVGHPDVELVLAGQLARNLVGVSRADDVVQLVDDLSLGDHVRVTGFIDVEDLGALYRAAELFVFPSIFEGFGLPPVEALGFGLPVITTRCSSLPEATLGLAEYVDDPFDASELAQRIVTQLDSGHRPSDADVQRVRETYDPARIGRQLYDLMTSE